MSPRLQIGISACFFHADPARPIFTGKTLQYLEQSMAHWVMSTGALAVMIPCPAGETRRGDATLDDYARWLGGLVLQGGSDVWPGSYGETPLDPRWTGDWLRDEYELALLQAFTREGKPVLGVCRGLQLLNVAYGGTLYQDIATQRPEALRHRDPGLYDRNFHEIELLPGSRLAALYPGLVTARVNSVHHQAIKDLGPWAGGRGALPPRRPHRGGAATRRRLRRGGPVAPRVPPRRPRHAGRRPHPAGLPRRRPRGARPMNLLKIENPATGELLDEIPADDAASVAEKALRARSAQADWAARPLSERVDCLQRFRAAVAGQIEPLATTLTSEVGKPIRQSRNELNGLLPRLDFFLAEVERSTALETVFAEGDMTERIGHEPLGVVANISAWNYPWFVGGNVFVPALLTGNAVLYKPSELATLTGLQIARLLHEAGVPPDVFVPLVGAGEVGAALLAQSVDGVFFTGSHATGARIAAAMGPRLVKLQLELGGKDPVYVCEDADVKVAATSLADGAMYNTGQSCCSVERLYVHAGLHDAFVEAFLESVRGFEIGDPMKESTYIGPLTRRAQLDVLSAQVADALKKGGTLRLGGRRLEGAGNWFEPTVFTVVNHSMELMREESFGPIIGIQKVGSDAEALALMNDTRYGLTAGVYTPDEARARRILAKVRAGSVYWNCCDRVSPRLPWSGRGDSGVGLTLSTYGIQTFTRPRAWHLRDVRVSRR